jgi:hypothetical protein
MTVKLTLVERKPEPDLSEALASSIVRAYALDAIRGCAERWAIHPAVQVALRELREEIERVR